jgi:hypothetical protein
MKGQHPGLQLVEPRFVINSAFKTKALAKTFEDNLIGDCFEKPIPYDKLREMLQQETK